MIGIVVPTVEGRENHLARCLKEYAANTTLDYEVVVLHNRPTCGVAWQEGADLLAGRCDYLHFTADDLTPHAGWDEAATKSVARAELPAPKILQPDGKLESCGRWAELQPDGDHTEMTRIPFMGWEQWEKIGPMLPIHYYCVPESHRALTQRGWRYRDELIIGEPMMVFDPITHEMRWEPLLDVNVFPYEGELMTLSRKGDYFEFTPNHRWPVITPRGNAVVEAHELKQTYTIPIRGDYTGGNSCLEPRLAAILGWVVGDGSYVKRKDGYTQMVVYQSERKYLAEAVAAVGREPQTSVIGTDVRTISVQPEDKREIEKIFSSKADLPRIAAGLSRQAAEAMMGAIIMAEGFSNKHGGRMVAQCPDRNPEVREAVQILSLMTGTNASLHAKDIFLKSSRGIKVTPNSIGSTAFTGGVWCPSTPTGTWIMEHNGAAIPTGNTDNWFSFKGGFAGYPSIVSHGYQFTHHWATSGRGAGMTEIERMHFDRESYAAAVNEFMQSIA